MNKIRIKACKDNVVAYIFIGVLSFMYLLLAGVCIYGITVTGNILWGIIGIPLVINFWYLTIRMIVHGMIDTWGAKWRRLPYLTDAFEWNCKSD